MSTLHSKSKRLTRGWGTFARLHERVQSQVEQQMLVEHGISIREYSLLQVLSRQHNGTGGHLQMRQVSDAVMLSQSATTRLVTRMEKRGLLERCLCPIDRRGIYTNVTPEGFALLKAARPTHDAALEKALEEARREPQFRLVLEALEDIPTDA